MCKHASFPLFSLVECENGLSAFRIELRSANPSTDLLHVEVVARRWGGVRRLRGDKRPRSTRRHSWLFQLGVDITCKGHAPLWARETVDLPSASIFVW
jgi:hypothetical protein